MVPSNFRLVVESRGREHFDAAMKMCFDAFDKACGYCIDKNGFHLFWHLPEREGEKGYGVVIPLPYPMQCKAASECVWEWLKTVDRGSEPDLDGSCKNDGFIVEHVPFGWGYEFVRVEAVWSEYHK